MQRAGTSSSATVTNDLGSLRVTESETSIVSVSASSSASTVLMAKPPVPGPSPREDVLPLTEDQKRILIALVNKEEDKEEKEETRR